MTAIEFPEQNIVFTKPESMTDEECGSLPAYRGEGQILSCWKLTDEDLKKDSGNRHSLGFHCRPTTAPGLAGGRFSV